MELPSTLVFDYPTISSISGYIDSVLRPEETLEIQEEFSQQLNNFTKVSLGVTSSACRLPGTDGIIDYQDNISMIPTSRWDSEIHLTEDLSVRFGAFLQNVFMFDHQVFGTSISEAALMDPQQRLILQMVEEAISQLRSKNAWKGSNVGTYVGISTPDFADIAKVYSSISTYSATGSALSVASGRLAFLYNLNGPAVSIDTACSSSMVGMHMACSSMQNSPYHSSIVSGIKLILTPETSAMFNRAGMLAADGRCKTLDDGANGYVRGEAGITLIVEQISEEREGCECHIIGTGVNQDGKSSALTAPNGPAQQTVMKDALMAGNVLAKEISFIQMHGTGTPLGDPIEVGAISAVHSGNNENLSLMAGKTSFGHTEPSAGLLGVLHAYTASNFMALQPIMHLTEANSYARASLSQNSLKFALPRIAAGNPKSSLTGCYAGISSFAFQGTNAHAIVRGGVQTMEVSDLYVPWEMVHVSVLPVAMPFLTKTECTGGKVSFEVNLSRPLHAHIRSHVVSGNSVFPGAGYMEIMAEAVSVLGALPGSVFNSIVFASPLLMNMEHSRRLYAKIVIELSDGTMSIQSPSKHIAGQVSRALVQDAENKAITSPELMMVKTCEPIATNYIYSKFSSAGLEYGEHFRLMRSVKAGKESAAAKLRQDQSHNKTECILNPAVLDCTLQLGGLIQTTRAKETMIPASLKAMSVKDRITEITVIGLAKKSAGMEESTTTISRDLLLVDSEGNEICSLNCLESRKISSAASRTRKTVEEDMAYSIDWCASTASTLTNKAKSLNSTFKFVDTHDTVENSSSVANILQHAHLINGVSLDTVVHDGHVVPKPAASNEGDSSLEC
eukprot:jgi/Picre1/29094/NNA_004487.t1